MVKSRTIFYHHQEKFARNKMEHNMDTNNNTYNASIKTTNQLMRDQTVSLVCFHHLLLEILSSSSSTENEIVSDNEHHEPRQKQLFLSEEDIKIRTTIESNQNNQNNQNSKKLLAMGQSIGKKLCELYLLDQTNPSSLFVLNNNNNNNKDDRDEQQLVEQNCSSVIVFLCKTFWSRTFNKRIDSLKTNNRGTFVLLDNNFVLTKMFSQVDDDNSVEENALYFASQILFGALQRLNVHPQTVKGEFVSKHSNQAVTFTIVV
jgi:hypothetical protein